MVVLVVDDDPAVLRVTAELFRHLGYRVLSAESGYDALARCWGPSNAVAIRLERLADTEKEFAT